MYSSWFWMNVITWHKHINHLSKKNDFILYFWNLDLKKWKFYWSVYLWIIWKACTSLNWPWKNLLWVEGSCRYLCPSALVFALLFVPVFVFVFVKSQLLNSWSQLICITRRARSQIGFERNLTFPICPTIRCGVKHWHVFTLNMDKDHQEYQRMVRFCCCGRSAKNFLVFKKAFLFLKFPLEMGYFLWNFSKPLWNALKGLGSNRQNWNVSVHHFFLQMTAHFVLFYSTSKLWNKMTGLKWKVFFRNCHIW